MTKTDNNTNKKENDLDQYYQELAQIDFEEACMQAGIPIPTATSKEQE